MTFDFDQPIDRRESDSQKWRACHGADVLPMWVADMDFASPACIVQALRRRVEHGVFGYPLATDEVNRAVTAWGQDHYGWPIDAEWIVWLPGLVPGLHAACLAYAAAHEEVLTLVPVYPPFLTAPAATGRVLKTIPLVLAEGRWTFDPGALAAALTPQTKLLLFHAAFVQGVTNYSGSAPHAEMGGYGTGTNDRGVRFYYEWVRDHVGRWDYPRHVKE